MHWNMTNLFWYPSYTVNLVCCFSFPSLGIQCATKKEVQDALKQREKIRVDPWSSKCPNPNWKNCSTCASCKPQSKPRACHNTCHAQCVDVIVHNVCLSISSQPATTTTSIVLSWGRCASPSKPSCPTTTANTPESCRLSSRTSSTTKVSREVISKGTSALPHSSDCVTC